MVALKEFTHTAPAAHLILTNTTFKPNKYNYRVTLFLKWTQVFPEYSLFKSCYI